MLNIFIYFFNDRPIDIGLFASNYFGNIDVLLPIFTNFTNLKKYFSSFKRKILMIFTALEIKIFK
jgi:hypothetical protein